MHYGMCTAFYGTVHSIQRHTVAESAIVYGSTGSRNAIHREQLAREQESVGSCVPARRQSPDGRVITDPRIPPRQML